MDIQLFAGVAVSDFDRAVDWYERLLGAPRTFAAHDTEWVWTVTGSGSIYVLLSPDRAGRAMVTMLVGDLDGFLAAAGSRGVHPGTLETYDNGVRKATYLDPDGNEIGVGGLPVADRTVAG